MFASLLTLAPLLQAPTSVPVRVDPRIELFTLVFRLIGAGEFNQPSSKSPYADAAEEWFGVAREHEACTLAKVLRSQHGIGFNAVPDLAVNVSAPPELELRVPLEPWPERLDKRWQGADIEGFLRALRSFAQETDFAGFQAGWGSQRSAAEQSLAQQVEQSHVLAWLKEFFGVEAGTNYTAIPGLFCGPANFGASVRLADGTLELWPVIGASHWSAEGNARYTPGDVPVVVHEFTHAFANPVVDAHWSALEPSFERLFPPLKNVMAQQAYGSPKTVAYESLVRACVVRHAARHRGAEEAKRQIAEEVGRGFGWTGELAQLLERYEAQRADYPTLVSFCPEIAKFFVQQAEKAPAVAK